MAIYNIIKLKKISPFHIGTGRENYDSSTSELQSDTLSAALAALRVQYKGKNDVDTFLNSFTLSSAFPFLRQSFFFPVMRGKINISVEGDKGHESGKYLKKLRYIDSRLWNDLVKGESIKISLSQLRGNLLMNNEESNFDVSFKSQVNQRVSVSRENEQDSDPFFFEWTFCHSEAGLYCLTDATGTLFDEIVSLFEILGEVGIGTDKNIGGGKFEVEIGSLLLPEIKNADHLMLLSLYIPTQEELPQLHLKDSCYELLLRGGYIAGSQEGHLRHLRKRSIYMFNVGSLFSTTSTLMGKVVDLAPEWNDPQMHAVYRSGRPFYLPVKKNVL
ncbi:MAG: type III-A CRISPR-associated RAMP protein Csm4 [Tannerellaceae bacterium]|jgi:CRISPR type III-A-associated RAMP protein Csm4|nr:type III-A CRISPR-associated RAMP protein Csm4 [Tannerellaceae bacterium]